MNKSELFVNYHDKQSSYDPGARGTSSNQTCASPSGDDPENFHKANLWLTASALNANEIYCTKKRG